LNDDIAWLIDSIGLQVIPGACAQICVPIIWITPY
jgi:hypothetical protein